MKLIRKLNTDDLISIVRNYFNVPEANISIDIQYANLVDAENGWDIEVTIEEDGYEVS